MPKLSKKQKDLLVKAFNSGVRNYNIGAEVMRQLEFIKDYETLWQDVSRFLGDYQSEQTYGRKTEEQLKKWVKEY